MRRILVTCSVMAMVGSGACFSVGSTNGASNTSGTHSGCELTLQANTLAGMCTQMTLHNTGSYPMQGWSITFDLPQNGHLSNVWDANFIGDTNEIVVNPSATNGTLAAGESISVGFCSTVQATNVNLTAGLCNTGDSENPNMTGSAVSSDIAVNNNEHVASDLADISSWTPSISEGTGLACKFSSDAVTTSSAGITLSSGNGTCGAVTRPVERAYGTFSATFQAAASAGVVTGMGVAKSGDQIAVQVDGANPWVAAAVVTHAGVTHTITLPISNDATKAPHTYSFVWSATGVEFSVDSAVQGSITQNIPDSALTFVLSSAAVVANAQPGAATFSAVSHTSAR